MKIVVWQNTLSHHQSAHVRGLADLGVDVTIVGLGPMDSYRKAMGWSVPDFGRARAIDCPSVPVIAEIVDSCDADCVHMLAGWRALPQGDELLPRLRKRNARIGLLAEGADIRGWKGTARRVVYAWERWRLPKPFDFILAMGTRGVQWYLECGYPRDGIFPYAYITEKAPPNPCLPDAQTAEYELLFLGALIRRKGVDLLLRALSSLQDYAWRLTIVGHGPERPSLEELAKRLGIACRTRLLPALPNSQAMEMLSCADLLVLPSRFDGWGAVVNEALMAGVPVVSSDRCGSKDLLGGTRGQTFRAGSVESLRSVLTQRISGGKRTTGASTEIRDWSRLIEGKSAARYVLAVLAYVYENGARPSPPWLQQG